MHLGTTANRGILPQSILTQRVEMINAVRFGRKFGMFSLLGAAGALVVTLVTAGFVLSALDRLLDSRGRDAIRARVEGFWFRTASLELHEQFQLAMRSRYAQMRRLQRYFLMFFIMIGLVMSMAGAIWGAVATPKEIKKYQEDLMKIDFDMRYSYHSFINYETDEPEFGNANGSCTIGSGYDDMEVIHSLGRVRADVEKFWANNESRTVAIRIFSATIGALVPFLLMIPLAIGLFISFNLTLWLLSRVTQSRIGATLIVLFDLALALIMPSVVSAILISLAVFAIIFSVDGMPDFASIDGDTTWVKLTFASVCFILGRSLSWPLVVASFTKAFSFEAVGSPYVVSTLAHYGYLNAKALFIDLGRIARFDLSIDPIETMINYAIGIDVLFSLLYIVPCLSLVLMQRSEWTRNLFLKIVQWIAEHPKGPIVALEEVVTAFAKYLAGLIKH